MRVGKLAWPSLNTNRARIHVKFSRITLWAFDLRLGRGVSQNFQPQRVSLRLILCFFSKSDGLLLFQLEIYFEPAILNGFCRLVYVELYDGHAKVQWSSWAKVWYVMCQSPMDDGGLQKPCGQNKNTELVYLT